MTLYRLFSKIGALLCAVAMVTACAPSEERLFAYREKDAAFEITFPALQEGGEDVLTATTVRKGVVTLTVLSPKRSAGTVITLTDGVCTLSFGDGSTIPLSREGAAPLTRIFSVLYRLEETDLPARKGDGSETEIFFEEGSLLLDESLLPKAVTVETAVGGERRVLITDYRILPEEET